ncbi:X2-like carbohydrate binding domain-containing protein [Natronospora cellulosivora (SeqCode)]
MKKAVFIFLVFCVFLSLTACDNDEPEFTLELEMTGSGSGVIRPAVGKHTYNEGELITIEAEPDEGSKFVEWQGEVTESKVEGNVYSTKVQMLKDQKVIVVFDLIEESKSAEISPEHAIFNRSESYQEDIMIEVFWNDAERIIDIQHDGQSLGENDYTVEDNTLTIKKEYLAGLEIGEISLDIEFNAGINREFKIDIIESTDAQITPSSKSFDLNEIYQKDLEFSIAFNDGESIENIKHNDSLLDNDNYHIGDEVLTIKKEFLETFSSGTVLNLEIEFAQGSPATIEINIIKTVNAEIELQKDSFDKNELYQEDIEIQIKWNDAGNIEAIKNNGEFLEHNEDYTLINDTLIISKDYLASFDDVNLEIVFDMGASAFARIEILETINASIDPDHAVFNRSQFYQEDIVIEVVWNNAESINEIKNDGQSLGENDYSLEDNTLTIKKEYLADLDIGEISLDIEFNAGMNRELKIDIIESTDAQITPSSKSFDLSEIYQKDLEFSIAFNDGESIENIKHNDSSLDNDNYHIDNEVLTIKKEFLETFSSGTVLNLEIEFAQGSPATIEINIIKTVNAEIELQKDSFDKNELYQEDIEIQIEWNDAGNIEAIKNNDEFLVFDEDYTLTNDTLTISKDYLASCDDVNLEIVFDKGASAFVEIEIMETTNASIDPDYAVFNKNEAYQEDIVIEIVWKDAEIIIGIQHDGQSLGENDYTVEDDILIIKKEYLAKLDIGEISLDIEFNAGINRELKIDIIESTDAQITPSSKSFDLNEIYQKDVEFSIAFNDGESIENIKHNDSLLDNDNYHIGDEVLTIKKEFLETFSSGTVLNLEIEFAQGSPATIEINIIKTVNAEIELQKDSFDKNELYQEDIEIQIEWNDAGNIEAIKNNDEFLVFDEDYTLTNDTLTISKDYLASCDDVNLEIVFDKGASAFVEIEIMETTNASITPDYVEFNKSEASDIEINIEWNDSKGINEIKHNDDVLIEGENYNISENTLIITKEYLLSLDDGSYKFEIDFLRGVNASITVDIAFFLPNLINENITLDQNYTIIGDLYLLGGTINLNGYNLTVKGNIYQFGGRMDISNGALFVEMDYRLQQKVTLNNQVIFSDSDGYLRMREEDGYVLVKGDFVTQSRNSHSGWLIHGVLELKGDFYQKEVSNNSNSRNNFYARDEHRVKFSGDETQKIHFDSPRNSRFARCSFKHKNIEFITGVGGWVLDGDVTISNSIEHGFGGTLDLGGHKFTIEGDFEQNTFGTIKSDKNEGTFKVKGNLHHKDGTFDLGNEGTLKIEENLYQSGGTMTINDGNLIVEKDYRIQSVVEEDGDISYNDSSGILSMQKKEGHVLVKGDFVTQSSNFSNLTDGVLELKSDFYQIERRTNNFNASGDHRVIFSGEETQKIYFDNPRNSRFARCSFDNKNIKFLTGVGGWVLDGDVTISNSIEHGFGGTLDLGGHKFTIEGDFEQNTFGTIKSDKNEGTFKVKGNLHHKDGTFDLGNEGTLKIEENLYQSGGTMTINDGNLIVEKDYRIQSVVEEDGDISYNDSSGILSMQKKEGHVLVKGDFVTQSSNFSNLTDGVLELKSDFYQIERRTNNFNASGDHRVIFSGEETQKIYFDNPRNSRFARCSFDNKNIKFLTGVGGWVLDGDVTISNSIEHGFGGTLDLGGHKFTIEGDFEQNTFGTIKSDKNEGNFQVKGNLHHKDGTFDLENELTLKVQENLYQSGGTMTIENGNLIVEKDYRIQSVVEEDGEISYKDSNGYLNMEKEDGNVLVKGDFVTQSRYSHDGRLTNGKLELKGDFYQREGRRNNFYASDDHRVKFSGEETQKIHFDSPRNSRFESCSFDNKNIEFLTGVGGWVLDGDVTISNSIEHGFGGTLDLGGHKFTIEGDFEQNTFGTIKSDKNEGNFQVKGNLHHKDGTFDLENELTLKVQENLYQSGGTMTIENGNLIVEKDYRIQSVVEEDGEISYKDSNGYLNMEKEDGNVLVKGDFVTQSRYSHDGRLTNGKLELKGDFYQREGRRNNFNASGDHRVIFSGEETQKIYFDNPRNSRFARCSFDNKNIKFLTGVGGWVLDGDVTISNSIEHGFGGTLDLGGHKFTIEGDFEQNTFGTIKSDKNEGNFQVKGNLHHKDGTFDLENELTLKVQENLYQSGGTMTIENGNLIVEKDYRIQSVVEEDGEISYKDSNGYLNMEKEDGNVLVKGDFVTQSRYSHDGRLTNGKLELKGDFYQREGRRNNFYASDDHRVKFSGEETQKIHFDSPRNSRFARCSLDNKNIEFLTGVGGWKVDEDLTIGNSIDHGFVGELNLNGNTFVIEGDFEQNTLGTIKSDKNEGTFKVKGNLHHKDGTFDLGNEGTLRIEGNLYQSGGSMTISDGNLIVEKDYRIQTRLEDNGEISYSYSNGYLNMQEEGGNVLVKGDFVTQSRYSHNGRLTNGVLELKGDFYQKEISNYSSSRYNFLATEDHLVIFTSDEEQNYYFDNPNLSAFANFEISN